MISKSEMKKQILEACRPGAVSFVELERRVNDFKGDLSFGYGDFNVFMWFGMSKQAADCIDELIKENEIIPKPSNALVYMIDGKTPIYDTAKKVGYRYKSPRWLPVVFWLKGALR